MQQTRAFAPGNVSCVFKIIRDPDPRRMHSLGMGFTVAEGVTATAREARHFQTVFNGKAFDFQTVRAAVQSITERPVLIELETTLPLSGGFGLSGASALAAVFAVNRLLELGLDRDALGMASHVAEVQNLTGLGDVGGQFNGGCLAKLVTGAPLAAVRLPVAERDIHYRYFSPILTKEIIGDLRKAELINSAADTALASLTELAQRNVHDIEAYIAVAQVFARESNLLLDPQVISTIEAVERAGGAASMIMLGNAVFSTLPFEGSTQTRLTQHKVALLP